jgi:CheY-like chemotaxis protein
MHLTARQKHTRTMSIDDNLIDQFLVSTFFRKHGFVHEVMCYSTAEDALLFLNNAADEEQLPGLVLLDINMPVMNGFDFLDAFLHLDNKIKNHCKIVMLSSSFSESDIEKATANPYVRFYLDKPLTVEKLKPVLQEPGR